MRFGQLGSIARSQKAMASLKYSANSYFVPRRLLLRIIVKRAGQSPTSIS
jgi:hypothetical protein